MVHLAICALSTCAYPTHTRSPKTLCGLKVLLVCGLKVLLVWFRLLLVVKLCEQDTLGLLSSPQLVQ